MRKAAAIFLLMSVRLFAAYTYNLTGVTQDDFEDCYYRGKVGGSFVKYVEAGDTIALPAGSSTWGASSRGNGGVIWIILPITVKGAGDTTIITLDETGSTYAGGVINLWATGIVWKDMKIKGAGDRPVTCFTIGGNDIRITNVTYEGQPDSVANNGQNGSGYFVFNQGYTGILIDHCRISTPLGDQEWIFSRGPTNAWQSSSTIGTSQQDIFVEDCTFTNVGYSDANANARHVFRFNTITGTIKFDAHGSASNSPARSFRSVEYYNNTWTSASMSSAAAMEIRGGTAMVFNNASTTGLIYLRDYLYDNAWPNFGHYNIAITAGSPVTIVTGEAHGYQTGWPVFIDCGAQNLYGFYTITKVNSTTFTVVEPTAISGTGWNVRRLYTAYDYPLPDQVGNGRDSGAREPAYVWGNTQGGGSWARSLSTPNANAQSLYAAQTGTPGATFTERDVIQANRDFFASSGFDNATGVSVGTRAAMDAYTPSVVGYGWWVTDEGSWNTKLPANTSGRLYKWTGSAWTLFYTPYTYPHPLQTATDCSVPEPTPAGGVYEVAQSVTIAANPSDATIHYTTNGTVPTPSIGTAYNGAFTISANTTLQAIAYKTGLNDSPVLTATYTITGQVFQPTSSIATNSYHDPQTVILATSTSGATIHYTLDGSTPNGSSPAYGSPLTVSSTTTVKAIAIKGGLTDSSVLSVTITILNEVGNWQITGSYQYAYPTGERSGLAYFTASSTGNVTTVSIYGTNTSSTQDIEIGLYEDTSGANTGGITKITGTPATFTNVGTWSNAWKDLSVSLPVVAGHKYWIFVGVSESSSLTLNGGYVGGVSDRWNNYASYGAAWSDLGATSNKDGWKFNIKAVITPTGSPTSEAATPVASPIGGVFSQDQNVTLTSATSGATIYYTLDGSTPTTGSSTYGTAIYVPLTQPGTTTYTLKAIAVKSAYTDSAVMSETYSLFQAPQAGLVVTTLNVGTLQLN